MEERDLMLVFIVDDDKMFLRSMEKYLESELPVKVKTFTTAEAAFHELHQKPEVVVIDYWLDAEFPDAWNGLKGLKKMRSAYPFGIYILISEQKNIKTVMESINEGAYQYLVKDKDIFETLRNNLGGIYDTVMVECGECVE